MSEYKSIISRREFLRGAAGVTIAAAAGLGPAVYAQEKLPYMTRVVLVRDSGVLDKDGKVIESVAARMLDDAVVALLKGKNAATVWGRLVTGADIVGIKSNVWAKLPTPPEIEKVLKQRVMAAGVPEKNISIRDREVFDDPIFQKATALINVRPLRTHHWAGVGGCIKNYIQFVPTPSDYHDEYCTPLGSIWTKDLVKGKTRLNILVVFQPLFYGIGPHHYDHSYTWRYCGMLVGTDPVAVDAVGLKLIEAKRREHFKEDRPLTPLAIHIARADTKWGIGTSDLSKIELIKLGWQEGVLI